MKKIVFVLAVLLLAAPAWAVDVWCVNEANLVTVKYDATSDDPAIRAFALDIELDGDGEFADGSVQCLSANFGYKIYPGDIDIDSLGNVDDWGSCKCSGSYAGTYDDSNSMTIEAGSLYEVGVDPDPCKVGDLVSFIVDGHDTVNVTLTVNPIRGGVVNEAADEVTPGVSNCSLTLEASDCLGAGDPGYARWVGYGKPDCWCYRRQCRGDADGLMLGPLPVNLDDLNILRGALNIPDVSISPGDECADFDHLLLGPIPVSLNDLTIMRTYLNLPAVPSVPECDQAPVITGPYNFWTN